VCASGPALFCAARANILGASMAGISEGEVAVYDRQLRLWGVQAQQRLLKAKVLIWGLEGCNVEACKNLVLAGVSLVIRDHRKVEAGDVAFNYFLRESDIGQNRAECAAKRVQEMNPLCNVSAEAEAPASDAGPMAASLKGCDVVCVSIGVLSHDASKACEVDNACRAVNSSCLLTMTAGEVAFFFSNLNTHVVQEKSTPQGAAPGDAPEPPTSETMHFPTLSQWLECTPTDLRRQKVDDSIILMSLFLAFSRDNKQVGPEGANKFEDFCRDVQKCEIKVDGYPDVKDAYANFFVEPLIHVASITAGLLAQEVIKAITKRDRPLMNSVCFNAHTCAALVECLPAPQKAAVKRKVEIADDILD